MKLYNLEKLVRIEVKDHSFSLEYVWLPERKSFWQGNRKEGFYSTISKEYIGSESPAGTHLIGDIVFDDAECTLVYQDGFRLTYLFNDVEKAEEKARYINELFFNEFGRRLISL